MPLDFDGKGVQGRTDAATREIKRLADIAQREIEKKLDEVEEALVDGYTVDRIRALQDEIKALGQELAAEIAGIIGEAVQTEVDAANEEADDELGAIGMRSLTAISEDVLNRIADQVSADINSIENRVGDIGTSLGQELRDLQLELLGLSTLEGEGLEERTKRIREALEAGRAKLPEKWRGSVEAYAEMVARTNMAEAARATNLARGLESGIQVFQVSVHGAMDSCGPYEGRLFSVDGKGENVSGTLAEVMNTPGHLFKPNCRHTLLAYVPELASEARANAVANAGTGPLPTKEELKRLDKEAAALRREQEETQEGLVDQAETKLARDRVSA